MGDTEQIPASLVRRSGEGAGTAYPLQSKLVTIGRDSGCDIVFSPQEAAMVSNRHAEVARREDTWAIRDLGSTNGTFLNGRRIEESDLAPGDILRFGSSGPEFEFHLGIPAGVHLDKTIVLPPSPKPKAQDEMLTEAVRKARLARSAGTHGQTMEIVREVFGKAVAKSHRPLRLTIAGLVIALVVVVGFSLWRIRQLQEARSSIDERILRIEAELQSGNLNEEEIESLLSQLEQYQKEALSLRDSIFYRFGITGRETAFIEREIQALMTEFGAPGYDIPPEFVDQVRRFIGRFQNRDRRTVERVLGQHQEDLASMREIFQSLNLPPALAYMVIVESAFISQSKSPAGAVGLWQFTPATARAYGLKVNAEADERRDPVKSTHAAAKYIRELILEFGSGSSVMLALAAYNYGPRRVKRAVRRVEDPIKQRDFWYLYRTRALPVETRQYVPKIVAAIVIGRNPNRFGF